jgi:hypothetical protein
VSFSFITVPNLTSLTIYCSADLDARFLELFKEIPLPIVQCGRENRVEFDVQIAALVSLQTRHALALKSERAPVL